MTRRDARTVRVGFELGTGEPITVPVRHMAVTGQTQESGKTTTLEAMIARLNDQGVDDAETDGEPVSAIAFVTKRGETSFADARRVAPYFRDRADWQFVTSIIDATLQEKNKFLRPWIMKICRSTETLADVQVEVRKALRKAHGISEGVYTQLDAYLELIVPEIGRVPRTNGLTLAAGLNVMDLGEFNTPMQMLFVQSAIDWVNAHAHKTIVIVPEAWEFVPEGKGSPVKQSAIELVRKGAGLGNYIWVDSQDMAGVDKVILRGCAVWLIGVQREANEIKRNLANIPASIRRPSAAAIANLDRGQFFACWKDRTVKLYVQPAWMNAAQAQQVATGQLAVDVASKLSPRARPSQPSQPQPAERQVNETEARRLRDDNARLAGANQELMARIDELEAKLNGKASAATTTKRGRSVGYADEDFERRPTSAREYSVGESLDNEQLYQAFKKRLLAELPSDPALLRIVASRPELRVEVERRVIDARQDTLYGRVALLIADGFFDEPKAGNAAFNELVRRGFSTAKPNVYREADKLALQGFLSKESGGYQAVPTMKRNIVEREGAGV
jgi:hypothetical protein